MQTAKILLASKDIARRIPLIQTLVRAGWSVNTATDPGAVLGQAFRRQPDVILLCHEIDPASG